MFSGLKTPIVIILLAIIIIFPVGFCYGTENTDFVPYCISVTFDGDVQSCRGITWYTNAICASDLLLKEEKVNQLDDFRDTKLYQGSHTQMERYTGRKALKKQVTVHRLNLAKLKADTTYVYKVGDAGRGIWSQPGTFHTASRENRLSFVIAADSQGEDEQDFLRSAQTLRMAMQTLPEANFIVHMGDFVQSYSSEGSFENFAEWQDFFATAQTELMNTTILPVAGNHDMSSNVFCSHFALDKLIPADAHTETGAYYAVNYANTCFIVLNSNEGYANGTGLISEQQVEWLKRTAAQADKQGAKWKILLMHRGIYSFGRHMDHADIIALRAQLAPIISDLGIDLVLQGHDHVYMRSMVLAKSASGQVIPQVDKSKVISANDAGNKLDFTVNPPGTTYIIPGLIGNQFGFRKTSKIVQVYPEAVYESANNDEPIFAGITIDENRLVYRAYAYEREGNGQVKEIDHYAILKDKEKKVEQSNILKVSSDGIAAVIGIPEMWQIVKDYLLWHELNLFSH